MSRIADAALTPEEVTEKLSSVFGEALSFDVHERTAGKEGRVQSKDIWIKTPRDRFESVLDELSKLDFPHFHIISGYDGGEDTVTLRYHFSLFSYVPEGRRVGISLLVDVPKSDLSMPSLFERIPGCEYSEREIREMFGVDFTGLPVTAPIFLPEEWDEAKKPWRTDKDGLTADDVRHLS
jgi:membrane-bound hydrogenase subunit beta